MRILPALLLATAVTAGCTPESTPEKAPLVERLASVNQYDERHLREVVLPSIQDSDTKLAFDRSLSRLKEQVGECQAFMRQVAAGSIPVTPHTNGSNWQSYVQYQGAWITATYSGPTGAVTDFQKHQGTQPFTVIYAFRFYTNGCLSWTHTLEDGFQFDELGRLRNYWRGTAKGRELVSVQPNGQVICQPSRL